MYPVGLLDQWFAGKSFVPKLSPMNRETCQLCIKKCERLCELDHKRKCEAFIILIFLNGYKNLQMFYLFLLLNVIVLHLAWRHPLSKNQGQLTNFKNNIFEQICIQKSSSFHDVYNNLTVSFHLSIQINWTMSSWWKSIKKWRISNNQ